LGGATANTSSHGSESSSRCSAQQEKQSVNIEDLSDSSEEDLACILWSCWFKQ
jgi:TATA-binding protein-associated factor Taf7